MKRNPSPKYKHGVYFRFNWFCWDSCCKCNEEFRREKGWRFLAGPLCGGSGHWYYLCEACAPTIQDAHNLAISGCYMPGRPKGPPPPPPPPKRILGEDVRLSKKKRPSN